VNIGWEKKIGGMGKKRKIWEKSENLWEKINK
jgi:hypothetical protein